MPVSKFRVIPQTTQAKIKRCRIVSLLAVFCYVLCYRKREIMMFLNETQLFRFKAYDYHIFLTQVSWKNVVLTSWPRVAYFCCCSVSSLITVAETGRERKEDCKPCLTSVTIISFLWKQFTLNLIRPLKCYWNEKSNWLFCTENVLSILD